MIQKYEFNDTTQLSPHFNISEFRCKCGKEHETLNNPELIEKLEKLYAALNCSKIIVTSGYRCVTHDKNVGGSGTGQHTIGNAADICCYGQDGQPISSKVVCCKAQDIGFRGIANITAAYTYTHVDVREKGKWYGDEVHGNSTVTDDFYKYFGGEDMKGIDVSVHNGNIDWNKVKADGIEFAILRAGFGRLEKQRDEKFEQNYAGAKAAGIPVGAYWYSYAMDEDEARLEADVFLKVIKGQSGKHLSSPIYGYKKSEMDKNLWVIDDEAAAVVRHIFQLSINGNGPTQIARILTEDNVLVPSAYSSQKGYTKMKCPDKPTRWNGNTVVKILEKAEYAGHTINFRTHVKSYKNRKRVENPKSEWLIFENTHEPIVSQHDFDLVQELRKNRCRPQKYNEINVFSGIVYCADCGKKMHVNRGKNMAESMKCSTYSVDSSECSAHYIRTEVLNEIVLAELNKLLYTMHENENAFVQLAMDNANSAQLSELKKAKKTLNTSEKRIAELDKLFIKLYEDNVSGKINDERFQMMSDIYDNEQKQLKSRVAELSAFIENTEQKSSDTMQFVNIVRKYEHITALTPEIMHELIEKIIVHAPDKSSGHRTQQIDIHFRFNVATATAIADSHNYNKQKKAA